MKPRPSRDDWAMNMVIVTAQRSTCLRRHVGCVLLNVKGHVLATGYNGVAAGLPHCNEAGIIQVRGQQMFMGHPHACTGSDAPSGTNLDGCGAIHAEQNALLQCRDVYAIDTAYVSASPCVTCVKLLLNTSCRRIVFGELYPHGSSELIWMRAGRIWEAYRRQ